MGDTRDFHLRLVSDAIDETVADGHPPSPFPMSEYADLRREPGEDPRLDALAALEATSRKIDDLARLLLERDSDPPRAA